jgi:hypothetical protein
MFASPILYIFRKIKAKRHINPQQPPTAHIRAKSYYSPTPSYSSLPLPARHRLLEPRACRPEHGPQFPMCRMWLRPELRRRRMEPERSPACPELPRAVGHGCGADLRCGRPRVVPPVVVRASSSLTRAVMRLGSSSPAPDHARPRPTRWLVRRRWHQR